MSQLQECNTLTRRTIQACLYSTNGIGPLPDGPIYNFQQIINDIFNCANYPLIVNNGCIEVTPGFCGSILQYTSGAWDVFRSPGITEITVGNTAKPPGANFSTVELALGQSLNTNCRFIRITDDTTDAGNINIPNNTLIYVDPGVTWTVTGTLTLNGTFTLTGSTNLASSRMEYHNTIGGVGNLYVQNIHLIHNNGVSNVPFVLPSIPMVANNIVVDCDVSGCFLSDVAGPANIQLDQCTLSGTSNVASLAISLSNATSVIKAQNITLNGTWSTTVNAIQTVSSTSDNIWNKINIETSTDVLISMGGDIISQVYDVNRRLTFTANGTNISNITFNRFNIRGDNLILSQARGNIMDMGVNLVNFVISAAFQVNVQTSSVRSYINLKLSDVDVNNLATTIFLNQTNTALQTFQYFSLAGNTQISNFRCVSNAFDYFTPNINASGSTATSSTTFTTNTYNNGGSSTVDGLFLGGNWRLYTANTPSNVASAMNITNSVINGVINYGMIIPVIPNPPPPPALPTVFMGVSGTVQFLNNTCNGLNVSNAPAGNNSCLLKYKNGRIQGNCTIFCNRNGGICYMNNFEVTGTWSDADSGLNIYTNGRIVGNAQCLFSQGARSRYENIEFLGALTIGGNRAGLFNNIKCMNQNTITVNGDNHILKNFSTFNNNGTMRSGGVTISGSANILDNWNVSGGSFTVTGTRNQISNLRMSGSIGLPDAATQSFSITGSTTILSNIHLGSSQLQPIANMTVDGFGSTTTGAFTIILGTAATTDLQVNEFSLYPKRGQTGQDITGALSATQTISIGAIFSVFHNMRFWSYPGGGGFNPHQAIAQTVTITSTNSQFNDMIVGYGEETTGIVGNTGIITVTGNTNLFIGVQTFTLNANTAATLQWIGCKIRAGGGGNVLGALTTICSGNSNFNVLAGIGGTTAVANT